MNLNLVLATAGVLAAVGLGCGSTNDGTLQQNWTIQGGTSPNACTAAGATQMRVVVVRSDGSTKATNFAACEAFTTSFSLDPDTYTAAATFLGADGLAVSATKIVPAFNIFEDVTSVQTIDFSLGDFIPR